MTKQITHFSSVLYSLSGSYFPQAVNYHHYKINKFRPHTWTTPIHWRTGCEVTVDRKLKMLARVNLTMHSPELRVPLPTKKTPASPGNSSPEITGPHPKTEGKIRKKNLFWDNSFSPNIWSQKHFFNSKSSLFHATVTLTPSFQGNCCSLFRACVTLCILRTKRHWSCEVYFLGPFPQFLDTYGQGT